MVSQEELGRIINRLAIADESTIPVLLESACRNEAGLLPDDLDKLKSWAKIMRILRVVIGAQPTSKKQQGT